MQTADAVFTVLEHLDRFRRLALAVPEADGRVKAAFSNPLTDQRVASHDTPTPPPVTGTESENAPLTTTLPSSPPNPTQFTLAKCPAHLLSVRAVATSQRKTCLSPPTLANRALSSVTEMSRTSYPCAEYVWTRLELGDEGDDLEGL